MPIQYTKSLNPLHPMRNITKPLTRIQPLKVTGRGDVLRLEVRRGGPDGKVSLSGM